MEINEREIAKNLIAELAGALAKLKRDADVLNAFRSVLPEQADECVSALNGNEQAAAVALGSRWPAGGCALSEYAIGDREAVHASLLTIGIFVAAPSKRKR